jgi:hypothetical protein
MNAAKRIGNNGARRAARYPAPYVRTCTDAGVVVVERRCGGCGNWFPWTHEHFYRNGGEENGLQRWCKRCMRKRTNAINRARRARDKARLAEQRANLKLVKNG